MPAFILFTDWWSCPENELEMHHAWKMLKIRFDPDWINDDDDEASVSRAFSWLNENGVDYVAHIRSRCFGHNSKGTRTFRGVFYVFIPDRSAAFLFRMVFPDFKYLQRHNATTANEWVEEIREFYDY